MAPPDAAARAAAARRVQRGAARRPVRLRTLHQGRPRALDAGSAGRGSERREPHRVAAAVVRGHHDRRRAHRRGRQRREGAHARPREARARSPPAARARARFHHASERDVPGLRAAVVVSSLGLIVAAGGTYVYLDIDKRASERELGGLQFCHLALRTRTSSACSTINARTSTRSSRPPETSAPSSASSPDEQRKARTIVAQMNDALSKQGRLVSDYASKTDEAQPDRAHRGHEEGLASVRGISPSSGRCPTNLKDLEARRHRIDATTTAFDSALRRADEREDRGPVVEGRRARRAPGVLRARAPPQRRAGRVQVSRPPPPPPRRPPPLVPRPDPARRPRRRRRRSPRGRRRSRSEQILVVHRGEAAERSGSPLDTPSRGSYSRPAFSGFRCRVVGLRPPPIARAPSRCSSCSAFLPEEMRPSS